MNELDILREQIDIIDEKFIELFESRMDISSKIGYLKAQKGMEILDSKREEEVIKKGISKLRDKELSCELEIFLRNIMELSKRVQERRTNQVRKTTKQ